MNLQELANEYKNQAELIKRKLVKLHREEKTAQGEELYRIRKRIKNYEIMQFECMAVYNELNNYYDK